MFTINIILSCVCILWTVIIIIKNKHIYERDEFMTELLDENIKLLKENGQLEEKAWKLEDQNETLKNRILNLEYGLDLELDEKMND